MANNRNRGSHSLDFSDILGRYGEKITGGVIKAIRDGGGLICADAKANVMVANKPITYYSKGIKRTVSPGALRDSIHIVDKTNQKKPKVYIVADARNPVDDVAYGNIIEWDPKKGRPFMYPAVDKYRDQIRENIVAEIKKAVRR